jgi:hypothetical protein
MILEICTGDFSDANILAPNAHHTAKLRGRDQALTKINHGADGFCVADASPQNVAGVHLPNFQSRLAK